VAAITALLRERRESAARRREDIALIRKRLLEVDSMSLSNSFTCLPTVACSATTVSVAAWSSVCCRSGESSCMKRVWLKL
jgi:hypothetical protein